MTLYHETNEELRKIQKRKEIRQALQKEFNRVYYNPRTISQHVEICDPALNRFSAMRVMVFEYWKPNWSNFWKFAFMTYIPICAFAYYQTCKFVEYDKKCRTGEIPLRDRDLRRF